MQNKVELSVRLRKIPKGADGQSAFKSIVFKRSATQPAAPTGGSYTTPVPGNSWSDGIPDESGGMPCWMSSRTFTSDGLFPQDAAWTTPKKVADTSDFDVCFSASETQPAISTLPPQGSNQEINGWHNTAGVNDIWMATATCSNGQWSAWSVVKIKGENGDDGKDSVSVSIIPNSVVYPEGGTIDASGNAVATSFTLSAVINKGGTLITSGAIQSRLLAATGNNNGDITSGNNKGAHFTGGVLTFATNATYEGVVIVTVAYDGESYTAPLTITRASKGAGGEQGPATVIPFVEPASITYTDGEEKNITLTCGVRIGTKRSEVSKLSNAFFNGTDTNQSGNMQIDLNTRVLTITSSASFQGILKVEFAYNGDTYSASVQINKTFKGDPGPAGLVWRQRDLVAGEWYYNDTAQLGKQEICYLDYIILEGSPVTAWTCKQTHRATASTSPKGSQGSTYWEKMSSVDSFYTPLLLANNASIDFMQGNSLKIFDVAGNLKAGVVGASGSYPIFFSNPRFEVMAVLFAFAVSSDGSTVPTSWTENAIPSNMTSGQYLWLRRTVRWSDGSETVGTQLVSSSVFSTVPKTWSVKYNIAVSGSSPTTAWESTIVQPTAEKTQLQAMIFLYSESGTQIGNGNTIVCGYYKAQSQSTAPLNLLSTFQVKDSGETVIGEPFGPRIIMSPMFKHDSGRLPRMEIYDVNGNIAALFDGSTVTDINDLYGGSVPSVSLSTDSGVAINTSASDMGFVDKENSVSTSFTCDTDMTIYIPAFTLNMNYSVQTGVISLGSLTADCIAEVLLDGWSLYKARLNDSGEDNYGELESEQGTQGSLSVSGNGTIDVPAYSGLVSKGSHTLKLKITCRTSAWQVDASGNDVGLNRTISAFTTIRPSTLTCSFSIDKRLCRYFANGNAIGASTSAFKMVFVEDGKLTEITRSASHGFKVDENGVFIRKPDGNWFNLESLIPS